MEIIIFLLLVVILILVVSLRNKFNDQIQQLHNDLFEIHDKLNALKLPPKEAAMQEEIKPVTPLPPVIPEMPEIAPPPPVQTLPTPAFSGLHSGIASPISRA